MTVLVTLGVAVGLIMGLTGAGGGVLAVPLLIFLTGLPIQSAAPIGLLAVALAASMAAIIGLRAGEVRYRAALLMGFTGLLCSPIGFWLAQKVDSRLLGLAFAAVLVLVAANSFRAAQQMEINLIDAPPDAQKSRCPCLLNPESGRFIWTLPCACALAFAGSLAGLMSGLLGVGGGFVLIPALQRFTNLSNQSVTLTSLAVIAIVSGFGVFNSAGAGAFNHQVGLPFAAASLLGMLAGRRFAGQIHPRQLKRVFGLVCLVVAALMVLKNF